MRTRGAVSGLLSALLLTAVTVPGVAQVDLLPIDHPATGSLLRLSDYGAIPSFPAEHLPVSRRDALEWIRRGLQDPSLPESIRREAEWHLVELGADVGSGWREVVIPIDPSQAGVFTSPVGNHPFTGLLWVDTISDSRVMLDPILDGEIRVADGDLSGTTGIVQGGVRLRGSVRSIFGFSATATNGTIVGSEEVARDDPRFGASFKFGLTGLNRDIDFGSGHARLDLQGASIGIGRERVQLDVGEESTLLFGAVLTSNTDWIRLSFNVGTLRYTHLHAALLGDAAEGSPGVGPFADIPTKYLAAHLLSVGPVAGIRLSIGEGVVYGGRPMEIGYLNPVNFLKSQEHYLRDRDNSLLYAAFRAWPFRGIALDGEFVLDDLVFSRIGTGYWGNKTAWRVGISATGLPISSVDVRAEYSRLEPYVYSHFSASNAYVHDGTLPAAGGNQPNSHSVGGEVSWRPEPRLRAVLGVRLTEHGANVEADTGVVRNVGGDVRVGFRSEISADTVTFLDGVLERSRLLSIALEYELLRNVYLRLRGFIRSTAVEGERDARSGQIWFGMRIGSI